IEFARNVARIKQATSQEFVSEKKEDPNKHNCVIHLMAEQKTIVDKGGTMRLGGWDCTLAKGTKTYEAYGQATIRERHRHRYEFNNDFKSQLSEKGMVIAGTTPDEKLVEIIELKDHPWFVGVQFHPEFTSRPIKGHPLFNAFIAAASKKRK
ncbi:MAG: gamma-glutamyl-gamma-aminobutyrate hydrolase family protein, partial [Candidatus Andersenbacteria bacterium]|nr:gamma-glutamyl-gamma-aminobutyrate hydrolase family protein [Candidatus Andersenbacteria bacterium]